MVLFKIRDGLSDADALMRRYCSTQDPAPLQTTGPYANIRFHSDYSLTDTGFLLTYATMQGRMRKRCLEF